MANGMGGGMGGGMAAGGMGGGGGGGFAGRNGADFEGGGGYGTGPAAGMGGASFFGPVPGFKFYAQYILLCLLDLVDSAVQACSKPLLFASAARESSHASL